MIKDQSKTSYNKYILYRAIGSVCIALVIIMITGCSHNIITEPEPLFLDTELSEGPPEFRQGYSDGCHTAMGDYGTSYMKTMYKLRKDPKYADNKLYNQIWKDGYAYCYQWLFTQRLDDSLL